MRTAQSADKSASASRRPALLQPTERQRHNSNWRTTSTAIELELGTYQGAALRSLPLCGSRANRGPSTQRTSWASLLEGLRGSGPSQSSQRRRKAGGAEIGAERVLQQLHHLGRLRGAPVLRARADENLLDQAGELERHAELAAELLGEEQILDGDIHGEADIVAAVEHEL